MKKAIFLILLSLLLVSIATAVDLNYTSLQLYAYNATVIQTGTYDYKVYSNLDRIRMVYVWNDTINSTISQDLFSPREVWIDSGGTQVDSAHYTVSIWPADPNDIFWGGFNWTQDNITAGVPKTISTWMGVSDGAGSYPNKTVGINFTNFPVWVHQYWIAGITGHPFWITIEAERYACADGIDNDLDGLIDYPADPGCVSAEDNDENNAACNDLIDNDGDGLIDYPADPGCSSLEDNDEYNLRRGGGGGGADCGDHQCTAPYEDEINCPADCAPTQFNQTSPSSERPFGFENFNLLEILREIYNLIKAWFTENLFLGLLLLLLLLALILRLASEKKGKKRKKRK